jgi:subtilisin family serine protease
MVRGAHLAAANAYRTDQSWVDAFNAETHPTTPFTVESIASGTSFAAPIVSGIAARLLQQYPTLTARQVWDAIYSRSTGRVRDFDGDSVPDDYRIAYLSVFD